MTRKEESDQRIREKLRQSKPMSLAERRAQIVSMAFGNLKLENDSVTRGMVERVELSRSKRK
ncbi:MAG: hypothetical protein IT381_22240 [Deltaproteobacteria bacterium]|nr:hypothetical protein [Deltaproteobacteria bacterium]